MSWPIRQVVVAPATGVDGPCLAVMVSAADLDSYLRGADCAQRQMMATTGLPADSLRTGCGLVAAGTMTGARRTVQPGCSRVGRGAQPQGGASRPGAPAPASLPAQRSGERDRRRRHHGVQG